MKRTIIAVILTFAFTAFAIQAVEQTAFSGAGLVESTTGGFKFPDGTVQASAAYPASSQCTAITVVPYIIQQQGVYCFTGDLVMNATTGNAIQINADNVVIELNGWMLDGLGAGTATIAIGIYGNERKSVTIRNGTVRGFNTGIHLEGVNDTSKGHIIEGIRADHNTGQGFWINGSSVIVRRNLVIGTGGGAGLALGIRSIGSAGRFLNNDIVNTTAADGFPSFGLAVGDADGAVVEGNRIDGVYTNAGTTFGIHIIGSSDVFVVDNRISTADRAVNYDTSTGKYRDNLTSNVTTDFTGGTDAGGNN